MVKNLVRVTVNLTPELVDRVEAYAERMNVNRTAAVSVLLSDALDQKQAMGTLNAMMEEFKKQNQ